MHVKPFSWLTIIFVIAFSPPFLLAQEPSDGGDGSAEVHYLSYQALSNVADSVSAKVIEKSPGIRSLIVCGSAECSDLIQARLGYEIFVREAKTLIDEYESLDAPATELISRLEESRALEESNSGGVQIAASVSATAQFIEDIEGLVNQSGSAVTSVISLIELFRRTDVKVESSSVVFDDSVLTTAIASRFRSRGDTAGVTVYLPDFAQQGNINVVDSEVFKTYQALQNALRKGIAYNAVFVRLRNMQIGPEDGENIRLIKSLNKRTVSFLYGATGSTPGPAETESDDTEDGAAQLPSLPSSPDYEILEGLILGERFSSMLSDGGAILRVKIIRLFGSRVTKSNLILGKRIKFSGSATVQYVLTDNNGKLLYADTEIFHTGFKKLKDLQLDQD